MSDRDLDDLEVDGEQLDRLLAEPPRRIPRLIRAFDAHRNGRRERWLRVARLIAFGGWVLFCTVCAVRVFTEAMR